MMGYSNHYTTPKYATEIVIDSLGADFDGPTDMVSMEISAERRASLPHVSVDPISLEPQARRHVSNPATQHLTAQNPVTQNPAAYTSMPPPHALRTTPISQSPVPTGYQPSGYQPSGYHQQGYHTEHKRPMTSGEDVTRISERSQLQERAHGGLPCLVQIYGKEIGQKFPMDLQVGLPAHAPQRIVLGRDFASCDIVCDMDNVSRQHCIIFRAVDGYYIQDNKSTNGTFINNREVKEVSKINNGDFIKIGGVIFKFLEGNNIEQLYYEEIYRMAIIDGLTQVYNKRYFLEFLDRELSRCQRHNRPLSLIMFDIDFFKKINDQYGHLAGDHVLRVVAEVVKGKNIRKEECLARYGGEEFGIILPDTGIERAEVLAEKIRTEIERTRFLFETKKISVTVSLGVAQLRKQDDTQSFMAAADAKLYQAKHSGRNRVCV